MKTTQTIITRLLRGSLFSGGLIRRSLSGAALRSGALAALLTIGTLSLAGTGLRPALAHETDCPYCQMPVTQNTATQDNEVALKFGRKRIEYKCVYCAVAEAKSEYKGDVTINSPSEKKGKPVILKRTGGKWSSAPAGAYFVSVRPLKHRVCQQQARAFTSKAAAQAYAQKNGYSTMTLAQLVATAK